MAKAKKPTTAKTGVTAEKSTKPRVRPLPKHRSFRLTKKRIRQQKPLPSAWQLIKKTWKIIWQNKLLFGGIAAVQVVISLVLVQGIGSSFDISQLKHQIEDVLGENNDRLGTGVALLSYLVSSTGSQASDLSSAYQMFLAVVIILSTIWASRQVLAGERPGVRDVFYKGMYPLIPFILVMLVIGLQLIPAVVGNFLYSTVISQGLAVTALEKIIWFLLFSLFLLLSLYMLASSLFALYIVTLPDMTPIRALRSARELVLHRRLGVMLRIIAFPILVAVLAVVIFLPLLIFVTWLAQPLFLALSSLGLVAANVYMYNLYRSLL